MITIHVQLRAYDANLSGWPAPFLRVPKTTVVRLVASGQTVADRDYKVDANAQMIYWQSQAGAPIEPMAEVQVTGKVTPIETPIVVAIVGAVATVLAAWIGLKHESPPASLPPHAIVALCRDNLTRLHTITDTGDSSAEAMKNSARPAVETCVPVLQQLERQ